MEYYWILSTLFTIFSLRSVDGEEELLETINDCQLYVTSYRNSTGQWVVTADSTTLIPIGDPEGGAKGEEASMDVKLVVSISDEMEVVQLYSTATVEFPRYAAAEYITFPGIGKYQVYTDPLTWFEAREKCISEGADLMILDSTSSVEVFKKLFNQFAEAIHSNSGYDVVHVGIYDPTETNNFLTIRGNPVNDTLWDEGQPQGEGYYCCYAVNSSALSNYKCDLPLSYICENRF